MSDYLEFKIDKFTFRVATDRYYSVEGVWVKKESGTFKLGISDYQQQRSGDVAFVEVKPEGTELQVGAEFATIETIKVDISLPSPLTGRIAQSNPLITATPETINQDPYGDGWLAIIEPYAGEDGFNLLLEPQAYFNKIKLEAEQDTR
jgi:glycine cleavage system H protein